MGTEPSHLEPEHPTWEVVVGVLRAAGSLVEAPLQGAELRGLPGLLEGAAEGAMGAAANVTSATLTLASALVDKLALYGDSTFETESEESSNAQSGANPAIGRGRGGATVTPRLRPPRPPPANHLEPLLPFNGVEAMARELHQYAAGGRFAKESFQFGAKLVRPRGAFVAVTDCHVIVGVNVGSSSETGASKWLAREALPLDDVVTVSRGEAEDASVVVLRALPRRIGRGELGDEDPKGDPSDDTTLVTPVADSALELLLRPVAYVAALAHRLGRENNKGTLSNGPRLNGAAPLNTHREDGEGDGYAFLRRRYGKESAPKSPSKAPGLGIREVALHCVDEACAGAVTRCLSGATVPSGREARGLHLA